MTNNRPERSSQVDTPRLASSESHTRFTAPVATLIFRPQISSRPDGFYVHVQSVTEPAPSGPRSFRSTSGPFATEATAVECLRRMLKTKMSVGAGYLIEVDGQRQASVEAAIRVLRAKRCYDSAP